MKRCGSVLFSFVSMVLISFTAFAQNPIPNPGFENWIGTVPDGWYANNIPGFAEPVQQSSMGHSGSFSLKAEIVDYLGLPYPAFLYSGDNGQGFPVSQRHATLTGYYQFYRVGNEGDALSIVVSLQRNGVGVGGGTFISAVQTSSWTQFNLDIFYASGEIPDTALIYIEVSDTSGLLGITGSYALVDDLSFMGISDIRKKENANLAQEFQLKQNYPNPFNPTTNIEFSIPQSSDVKLVIYNQLGQTVATLVNERLSAGGYSVDWNAVDMPSGIYFYKISAGDFTQTRKLVLMK